MKDAEERRGGGLRERGLRADLLEEDVNSKSIFLVIVANAGCVVWAAMPLLHFVILCFLELSVVGEAAVPVPSLCP